MYVCTVQYCTYLTFCTADVTLCTVSFGSVSPEARGLPSDGLCTIPRTPPIFRPMANRCCNWKPDRPSPPPPVPIQSTDTNSKRDVQPLRLGYFSYPLHFCAFLLPVYILNTVLSPSTYMMYSFLHSNNTLSLGLWHFDCLLPS